MVLKLNIGNVLGAFDSASHKLYLPPEAHAYWEIPGKGLGLKKSFVKSFSCSLNWRVKKPLPP